MVNTKGRCQKHPEGGGTSKSRPPLKTRNPPFGCFWHLPLVLCLFLKCSYPLFVFCVFNHPQGEKISWGVSDPRKWFGNWLSYTMKCFIFMFMLIVPIKQNIANTYCHNSHIYKNGPKDSMILIMIYLCAFLMES